MKHLKASTWIFSLTISLSACVSTQNDWPDAQDQMAGFAKASSASKRYPASQSSSLCYDKKDSLGLSKDARIVFSLKNIDVAYAAEYGGANIFLQSQLLARSTGNGSTRPIMTETDYSFTTSSLLFDTYLTAKTPDNLATIRFDNLEDLRSTLSSQLKSTESAQVRIDIMGTIGKNAQTERLGSLWIPLDGIKEPLSKNPNGVIFQEETRLKYRGLASIETAILCGPAAKSGN